MPTYGVYSSDKADEVTVKKLSHTSDGTLGFFGTTPTTAPAVTYNATITASFIGGTNGFGFDSSDAAISVIGALKDVQHVLTRFGLWS